jgi:integrase
VVYLEKQDLAKLLRTIHATNKTHHLISLICFFAGARISQTLNVRGEDIFQREGKWVVKIRAAKRGNAVIHPLHFEEDPAFSMLPLIELAALRGTSLLFGSVSRQYYNLCLKGYCAKAGIHTDAGHSHIWRHSIGMQIFQATQQLGAVSQFLGHRSVSAALFYLAVNSQKIGQEAVENLTLA